MNKNLLTFIIPIYHPTNQIEDILKNILKQKDQNFNVIICIDKPNEEQLEYIKQTLTTLKNRVKLIINTSHLNITKVLQQALEMSETIYSYIFYSYSYIKSEFTLNVLDFLAKAKTMPDFIEFNGYIRGINHIDFFRSKYEEEKIYDLSQDKSPITMISPYIFNAIIKTDILKNVFSNLKIKNANLQLSCDFKYASILKAKTFAYIKRTWVEDFNYQISLLNPKNIETEWNIIEEINNQEFTEELKFAKMMHLCYFAAGFLGQLKFKKASREAKILKNFSTELLNLIKKFNEQNPNFQQNNNYFKLYEVILPTNSELEDAKNWKGIIKKFKW